jgi:hypothetical protein
LVLTTAGIDRQAAQTQACRANLRQLVRGWSMYAVDNRDRLPANQNGGSATKFWCDNGFLDFTTAPANWDPGRLTNGLLWKYVPDADAWHCPGDLSVVRVAVRGEVRRIRSYSMNGNVGSSSSIWSPGYRLYQKTTDLTVPGADRTFVFLDEHPGSINDGYFAVSMNGFGGAGSQSQLIDFPGSHHAGAGNLSFGDDHVETWKWRDARTKPPFKAGGFISLNIPSPNNPDVPRIQAAATARP